MDRTLSYFVITNVLTELCEDRNVHCLVGDNHKEYTCVILYSDLKTMEMEREVKQVLQRCYSILQERMKMSVLFTCGFAKDTLQKCKASFDEAYSVNQYKLLYQEKGLHYYLKAENIRKKCGSFLGRRADELMFYMRTNNREEIDNLLSAFFAEMKKEKIVPEFVALHVNDIVSCVLEFAEEAQIYKVIGRKDKGLPIPDFSRKSIDEICLTVKQYVNSITDMANINITEKTILPEKVVRYIMDNFSDSELSLETITKALGISRTILCRQFRDVEKKTIGEFILQIRMNHAKELMDKGYNNITFIAEKCGYEDAGYFAKRFKKYFGVTPSDYIKKLI